MWWSALNIHWLAYSLLYLGTCVVIVRVQMLDDAGLAEGVQALHNRCGVDQITLKLNSDDKLIIKKNAELIDSTL